MARSIAGLFEHADVAQRAVRDLIDNGVAPEAISLVALDSTRAAEVGGASHADAPDAAPGDAGGAALNAGLAGGALGALLGAGALLIPGVGPVLALGPLAGAFGGATVGGLAGAAVGAGTGDDDHRHSEWLRAPLAGRGFVADEADRYAVALGRGDALVIVDVADIATGAMVGNILMDAGAREISRP